MSEITVKTEQAWSDVVAQLWELSAGKKTWLLTGDLGSGKTTLVRHLMTHLGIMQKVSSPTFSIVNTYSRKSATQWDSSVHHCDLYRLESIEEALDIGLEELLDDDILMLVEWPEIADAIWPPDSFRLHLSHDNSHRKVIIL